MKQLRRALALAVAVGAAPGIAELPAQAAPHAALARGDGGRAAAAAGARAAITLDYEDAPARVVLQAIARQGGLAVVYATGTGESALDGAMTQRERGASVTEALANFTRISGVEVVLTGRTVVVRRPPAPRESGVVVGRVTDAKTGAGIVGAEVTLEGTRGRAVTREDGGYRLVDVAAGRYTLVVRRLGYAPVRQAVTVADGQEVMVDVVLEARLTPLDEVVVTGSMVESQVRAMPVPVTVITAQEIEQRQIRQLDQLFRGLVPSAVSFEQGNVGVYGALQVRGTNGFNSAFLKTYVDGVELVTGDALPMLDPASIERIEIIRGPQAATLYGADAIGGVMQIFTKKGSGEWSRPRITLTSTVGVVHGDYAGEDLPLDLRQSLQVSGGREGFSYNLGVRHNREGKWVADSWDRTSNITAGLTTQHGPLSAAVSLGYLTRKYVYNTNPPFLAEMFPGVPQFEPMHDPINENQHTLGLNLAYAATSRWQHTLILGVDRGHRAWLSGFATSSDGSGSIINTNRTKSSLRYHTSLEVGLTPDVTSTITAGADYWQYDVDEFLVRAPKPQLPGRVPLPSAMIGYGGWSNSGYFSQVQVGLRNSVFLTAGLRAEDNANFGAGHGLAWAPKVGATYTRVLGPIQTKLRAAWGKAIRPPTPEHRYGAPLDPTYLYEVLPNPGVLPEEQTGWEGGLDFYLGRRFSLGMTYYDQDVNNMISVVEPNPGADTTRQQFQNLGKVRNHGLELEGTLDLAPFDLRATYSATTSRYEELAPGYGGFLQVGDENYNVPRSTLGGMLAYNYSKGAASIEISRIGHWTGTDWIALYRFVYGYEPFRGSYRDYWIDYGPITKLNLQVSHDLTRQLTAVVRAENLTDVQDAELYGNLSTARGRAVYLTLRFTH